MGVLALAWLLSPAVGKPRDPRLRSIVAVVACWTAGPATKRAARHADGGLVRISPYLAHIQAADAEEPSTPTESARQLRQALHARPRCSVPGRPMPIARLAAEGLDADVDELLVPAGALGSTVYVRTRRAPHVVRTVAPGASRMSPSPVRKALGGHVIGSTARPVRRRDGASVSAENSCTTG
ncbi:hypothetical protein DFR70_1021074 [Nocardia tenerifensis]|uniref:Uncharacterized protein n=1 Tax=Nocardia tenerifensis TaxID=228006 RepID=A0A318K8E3_9NOCA|nr:hypothetical protein DFR70_1021074 [Nocardia tenerifensis]